MTDGKQLRRNTREATGQGKQKGGKAKTRLSKARGNEKVLEMGHETVTDMLGCYHLLMQANGNPQDELVYCCRLTDPHFVLSETVGIRMSGFASRPVGDGSCKTSSGKTAELGMYWTGGENAFVYLKLLLDYEISDTYLLVVLGRGWQPFFGPCLQIAIAFPVSRYIIGHINCRFACSGDLHGCQMQPPIDAEHRLFSCAT
jgi:hypothetical protein